MEEPLISPAPRSPAKKNFRAETFLKILLAVFLIGFVARQTSPAEILALRERVSLGWAALTLFLLISLTFLKAQQYHVLTGRKIPYARVASIVVWQNALTNFVAAGAGVASYLALFKAEPNVKFSRATLAFLIAKVGDVFSIWIVLLVYSTIFWQQIMPFHNLVLLLVFGIGLSLLGFFAVIILRSRFISAFHFLLHKSRLDRLGMVQKLASTLDVLAAQEPAFIYRNIAVAFSYSLLYYLLTLAWMIASMRMFSAPLQVWMIVFTSGLLQLLSIIPFTIFGSLGITEFSSLYIYGLLGVSQPVMSPILLGWRAFFYLGNLFILGYLPLYTIISRRFPAGTS